MKFRESLFWDVNPEDIDEEKHAIYIIERIMDFGNDAEVRWMWGRYPRELMHRISEKSRVLRGETRSLWQLMTKTS